MYKWMTIASLSVGAIMCALIAIAPKHIVKKSLLEAKSKLMVLRISAALIAIMAIAVIVVILNNPDLFS